jgi:hypothetical protein
MPRSLRGLALAGALLVLAGCSVGGREAREPTEPQAITKAQLAAMVLPLDELGTIAEGMELNGTAGPVGNEEAADGTLDPGDTGKSLRSTGRLGGHKAYFTDRSVAASARKQGVISVGTEIELMEDPVYAAQYLHKQLGDFERFQGKQNDGTNLAGVASFQVNAVGDEAEGLLATASGPKRTVHATAVAFRRARIVAVAMVIRTDKEDAQGEARALAVKLDGRIRAVLAGEIEVGPAPADDATVDAPVAAVQRLPEATLQPEDVGPGVTPVDEGPLAEPGYVGYQRTFEDVVLGGSHLIRLQARTAAYERPAQAAVAHRLVTQAVGREAFADGIARAFGGQTAVAPTNVRVRSFATGARGMTGVVATFELVGARFKMVSIFTRSGRFLQSVTGICRPDDVQPDDLEALARRAQARLVA